MSTAPGTAVRPAHRTVAAVGSLVLAAVVLSAQPASARTAHPVPAAVAQPGPTQVINDLTSAGVLAVTDENGRVLRIRRGGYVLGDDRSRFFTRFYVPRGTTASIVATDPYGEPLPAEPVLQVERSRGWKNTNAKVNNADLVKITLTSRVRPV